MMAEDDDPIVVVTHATKAPEAPALESGDVAWSTLFTSLDPHHHHPTLTTGPPLTFHHPRPTLPTVPPLTPITPAQPYRHVLLYPPSLPPHPTHR